MSILPGVFTSPTLDETQERDSDVHLSRGQKRYSELYGV